MKSLIPFPKYSCTKARLAPVFSSNGGSTISSLSFGEHTHSCVMHHKETMVQLGGQQEQQSLSERKQSAIETGTVEELCGLLFHHHVKQGLCAFHFTKIPLATAALWEELQSAYFQVITLDLMCQEQFRKKGMGGGDTGNRGLTEGRPGRGQHLKYK